MLESKMIEAVIFLLDDPGTLNLCSSIADYTFADIEAARDLHGQEIYIERPHA